MASWSKRAEFEGGLSSLSLEEMMFTWEAAAARIGKPTNKASQCVKRGKPVNQRSETHTLYSSHITLLQSLPGHNHSPDPSVDISCLATPYA